MPFVKGESGNPAGRPPGSRNKKSLLLEAMLDAEGESLTRRMIGRALDGDGGALRMCIDRVLPRGRDRIVPFALPPIESAADARTAAGMITVAIGTGELTPREGMDLLRVAEKCLQVLAAAEEVERAARREQQAAGILESLQGDVNRRLARDTQARAAASERALAAREDVPADDDEGPAARVPATGGTGAVPGAAGKTGQARGQQAVNGKNNRRDNNENTMEPGPPRPAAALPPWPLAAVAQPGGAQAWLHGPDLAAAPRGLRRRLTHLLGSSAMAGPGGLIASASALGGLQDSGRAP